MNDPAKSSVFSSWIMLCGTLSAVYLSGTKLLNWNSVSETNSFATLLLVIYVLGISCTCFNWVASKQFKISILNLIGLTAFVSVSIATPTLAIVLGLALIGFDDHSRTEDRRRTKPTLHLVQRFAVFSGIVYVAAMTIQTISSLAGHY